MARKLLISLTLVAALLPPALRAQQPDEDDLAAAQALDLPSPLEQADLMLRLAQQVQSTQAAQAVQQIALRLAARQAGAEPLALERRDLTEERARIAANTGMDPAPRSARLDEIDTRLIVNGQKLAEGFPGWRKITAPDPVGIEEAQALLAPDEALVVMHQADRALLVWLVAKDRVIWHRVAMRATDAPELVALFRAGMGLEGELRGATALKPKAGGGAAGVPSFDMQLSAILFQLIFGPFAEEMAAYPHLRIVPDGAWVGLPFATLLTTTEDAGKPFGPGTLREASWMVRRHAITVMPSVVSLRALSPSGSGAAARPGTLLAIGDPVFSGTASAMEVSRAASGAPDVSALAPLPGTRREVEAIAAAFPGAQVLLGAEASEAAIRKSDLSAHSVIVFATHGLIAGELQGLAEPALALTPPPMPGPQDDGLLTAGEIAGLTLSAGWVVLSACNTAAGDGAGAEGLSGLARAFFAAGAESLLVSHWPVRDDAAARLTAYAFAAIQAEPGLRKAEAMRRSMLALMADESDASLAHPMAWAPFFVVGGGA